jgi:hypothetical protein
MAELHHFTLGRARITTETCGESERMMISEEADVQGGRWVLGCAGDFCSNISTRARNRQRQSAVTFTSSCSPISLPQPSKSKFNSICPQMMLNLE